MQAPNAISVDPDEVRNHAAKLVTLMDSLSRCLEAATYLRSADDGYGLIPRPIVQLIMDDNHRNTITAIRKLSEDVARLPDLLNIVATTFDEKDAAFSKSLTELRDEIVDAGGSAA